MAFSAVTWMLHLLMPSMSDGLRPASSRASLAASSAVTSSERPMFLENGSWPIPTTAALSLSDTGSIYQIGQPRREPSQRLMRGSGRICGGRTRVRSAQLGWTGALGKRYAASRAWAHLVIGPLLVDVFVMWPVVIAV